MGGISFVKPHSAPPGRRPPSNDPPPAPRRNCECTDPRGCGSACSLAARSSRRPHRGGCLERPNNPGRRRPPRRVVGAGDAPFTQQTSNHVPQTAGATARGEGNAPRDICPKQISGPVSQTAGAARSAAPSPTLRRRPPAGACLATKHGKEYFSSTCNAAAPFVALIVLRAPPGGRVAPACLPAQAACVGGTRTGRGGGGTLDTQLRAPNYVRQTPS